MTAVPGAEMRFTTDGTVPTVTSLVLTNPYLVTRSQTLIVVATAPGSLPSEPGVATYTCVVADPVATPVSGVFLTTATVHVSSTTPGATLRFTVDGTAPTDSSPVWAADLPLTTSTALSWRAFRAGWTASGVTTGTWSIQTPMPTVDVPSGTYNMDMAVLATPAQSGTTLRFTTDGTVPDAQAATITGALTINRSQTVTVVAQRDGCLPSDPVVRQYLMQVATPTVDVPAGRYHQPIAVTVEDATPTAQVAMTTNGTVPGADAPNITAPISLDQPTRLTLVGRRPGWTDSLPVVLDYAFQVAAPTIEPPAGTHVGSLQVTGSTATPGATLRWVAGTEPPGPTADPLPVSLDQTTTLTIQGVRTGWEPSTPMTATWTVVPTISFATAATTMSEAALPQDIALRLSGPAPRDITLTVTILDGTAVADVDIRLLSPTVTIAAGAITAVLRVEPINRHRLSGSVACQIGISVTDGAQFIGVPHAVTIQAEGVPLPPPVFTQRRSPMWKQPVEPFDYARWTNDAVYRTAYVAAVVPERVWECAADPSYGGTVTIRSQQWGSDSAGSWCDLSLHGPVSCPITVSIIGATALFINTATTMTVVTDDAGMAMIRVRAQANGPHRVVIGSPFILETQRWALMKEGQL